MCYRLFESPTRKRLSALLEATNSGGRRGGQESPGEMEGVPGWPGAVPEKTWGAEGRAPSCMLYRPLLLLRGQQGQGRRGRGEAAQGSRDSDLLTGMTAWMKEGILRSGR